MATKIKGLCKGFKQISQIFVVKDHGEMEIGYPTDVKHVAHIGLDGPSGAAPSWMNGFKSGPKFSATSDGNKGEQRDSIPISHSPWASQAQGVESQLDNAYGVIGFLSIVWHHITTSGVLTSD